LANATVPSTSISNRLLALLSRTGLAIPSTSKRHSSRIAPGRSKSAESGWPQDSTADEKSANVIGERPGMP
jgi:hypothetical protein